MTKQTTPLRERKRVAKRQWRERNPGVNTERSRAWRRANPERTRELARNWYRLHQKKQWAAKVFRQYALTLEEYDRLMALGCVICGETKGRLHMDHDHETGVVRGVLCLRHNLGIGYFRDNPQHLTAAAEYLRRFAVRPQVGGLP